MLWEITLKNDDGKPFGKWIAPFEASLLWDSGVGMIYNEDMTHVLRGFRFEPLVERRPEPPTS